MKIRNGFVSNSSSSSFVIVGRPKELKEAQVGDHVIGEYINEGTDFFILDEDMIELIKKDKINSDVNFEVFEVIASGEDSISLDEDNMRILPMLFKSNCGLEIRALTIDYNNTDNLEDFKKNYCK